MTSVVEALKNNNKKKKKYQNGLDIFNIVEVPSTYY